MANVQLLSAYPHFFQSSQSVFPLLPLFHYPLERTSAKLDRYLHLRQMVCRTSLLLIQFHGDIRTLSLFEPHQECLPLAMSFSAWPNSFGKIDFLPNVMSPRQLGQQLEDTYSSELWLLHWLLLHWLCHLFCSMCCDASSSLLYGCSALSDIYFWNFWTVLSHWKISFEFPKSIYISIFGNIFPYILSFIFWPFMVLRLQLLISDVCWNHIRKYIWVKC